MGRHVLAGPAEPVYIINDALPPAVPLPGVDIGDVTINNGDNAAAVPIRDGGNTITVDGSVTAIAQPGTDIGDVTVNNGAAGAAVNIQDGGNAITVDGSVTIGNTASSPVVVQDRPLRAALATHRSAITSADKIIDFTAGDVVAANVAGTQGSLAFNTTYYITAIPGNRWGSGVPAAIDSLLITNDAANTHVAELAINQAVSAEWYDLFLSVDTAPKLVARITEAQRLDGCEVLTLGTVTAPTLAGLTNIGCVGTGIQTTNSIFAQSNAYTPAAAGIVEINCTGYSKLAVYAMLSLTDLRTAPSFTLIPFFGDGVGNWCQGEWLSCSLFTAVGQTAQRMYVLDVDGALAVKVLVGAISGQGAACTIKYQLV